MWRRVPSEEDVYQSGSSVHQGQFGNCGVHDGFVGIQPLGLASVERLEWSELQWMEKIKSVCEGTVGLWLQK